MQNISKQDIDIDIDINYNTFVIELCNIIESLRKYEYNLISIETLEKSIQPFATYVQIVPESYRLQIADDYVSELLVMISKLRMSKSKKLASFCDTILVNKLEMNKNKSSNISYIFEEFIKGITYFRYQEENAMPIYHRLYSCGKKTDSDKLYCNESNKSLQKKFTETCYIERLVYTELLTKMQVYPDAKSTEPNKQNKAHDDRNELTRKQYQSCYTPKSDITVHIEYDDTVPVKLIINKLKDDKIISTETYVKTYTRRFGIGIRYDVMIDCFRTYKNNNYIKFQTYFRESNWIKNKPKHMLTLALSDDHHNLQKLTSNLTTSIQTNNTI